MGNLMLLLGVFSCILFCRAAASHSCEKELKNAKIIPKYADKVGKYSLKMLYNNKKTEVKCGNHIGVDDILETPFFSLDVKKQCKNLTIIYFDLDAIFVPPYLHLLVTNVPRCTLKKGFVPSDTSKGNYVSHYVLPLTATGNHRYTAFAYCQKKELKVEKVNRKESFPLKEFVKKHDLGDPVAINFFYLNAV